MLQLNITSITDEILAMTALRKAVAPGEETPEILTRDRLPGLRVLVRGAFARLCVSLSPILADAATDERELRAERPYNSSEPVRLEIGLGAREASMTAGKLLTLKRYLEHLLALMVLREVYLPLGEATDLYDRGISEALARAEELVGREDFPGELRVRPVWL